MSGGHEEELGIVARHRRKRGMRFCKYLLIDAPIRSNALKYRAGVENGGSATEGSIGIEVTGSSNLVGYVELDIKSKTIWDSSVDDPVYSQ